MRTLHTAYVRWQPSCLEPLPPTQYHSLAHHRSGGMPGSWTRYKPDVWSEPTLDVERTVDARPFLFGWLDLHILSHKCRWWQLVVPLYIFARAGVTFHLVA